MVTEYELNESARSAISYIGELSRAHSLEINQNRYTLIRDFILTQMTIAKAYHADVFTNMTVHEYKKAQRIEGKFVISVKNHKTADTHGPVRVVLSPVLFSYLKVYVEEVRSQVVNSSSDNANDDKATVFLSWNGAALESGQISTAINAAWHRRGMHRDMFLLHCFENQLLPRSMRTTST